MLRDWVKNLLLSRDIILSRPPGQFSIEWIKLERVKRRGLRIDAAVDGGASDGSWTREFRKVYPDAKMLSVEPRGECQPDLQQTARDLAGVIPAATLIGATEGTVEFNVSDTQSSMLKNSRGESFGTTRSYPITTLDALVQKLSFPWPDLIKLDLQGAELEALKGATQCLQKAQALMLEVSFIPLQAGSPLLYDMVTFCHDHGFRAYDISGLWHRPLDGALAQGDFLFLKEGHALLTDARWSEKLG